MNDLKIYCVNTVHSYVVLMKYPFLSCFVGARDEEIGTGGETEETTRETEAAGREEETGDAGEETPE